VSRGRRYISSDETEFHPIIPIKGRRPNEAFALRWEDIDFDRVQLRIRRSIHRFAGIGLPKAASNEREVAARAGC
jgi:integrase